MEKFLKNPLYQGIAIFAVAIIIVLWAWDSHKNPNDDMFGLLKKPTTV